jgi:hypothetical protein
MSPAEGPPTDVSPGESSMERGRDPRSFCERGWKGSNAVARSFLDLRPGPAAAEAVQGPAQTSPSSLRIPAMASLFSALRGWSGMVA